MLSLSSEKCLTIAVGIAWSALLYKARVLLEGDRSARTTWFGIFFLVIYQTISISWVQDHLDSLALNLSWLLAYSAAMISLYFIALTGYAILATPTPRWIRPVPIIVLSGFVAIYLTYIISTPNYIDRTVPRSIHDLAFVNTALTYDIFMCSVALSLFLRLCRQHSSAVTRLRWGVVSAALVVTNLYLIVKIAVTTMNFFHLPSSSLMHHLLGIRLLMWLMWSPALLANKHYLVLLRPFMFADRMLTFARLRIIQAKLCSLLRRLGIADMPLPAPFLQCLGNLRFHTHWTFLSILDGNLLLKTAEPDISNATLLAEALKFRQTLAKIPADTNITLPTVYKHTGRLAREL